MKQSSLLIKRIKYTNVGENQTYLPERSDLSNLLHAINAHKVTNEFCIKYLENYTIFYQMKCLHPGLTWPRCFPAFNVHYRITVQYGRLRLPNRTRVPVGNNGKVLKNNCPLTKFEPHRPLHLFFICSTLEIAPDNDIQRKMKIKTYNALIVCTIISPWCVRLWES